MDWIERSCQEAKRTGTLRGWFAVLSQQYAHSEGVLSYICKLYLENSTENMTTIKLPSGKVIDTASPIVSGGHFSWHEALWSSTYGKHQVPASIDIENNIVMTAQKLEKVRHTLGDAPIRVNSWYRNPQVNAMVGGYPNSAHLRGYAVDIVHSVLTPKQVWDKFNLTHDGGLGRYASFIHIDFRGSKARWRG